MEMVTITQTILEETESKINLIFKEANNTVIRLFSFNY